MTCLRAVLALIAGLGLLPPAGARPQRLAVTVQVGRSGEVAGTNVEIQQAMDEAARRGATEVIIPAGEYVCHNSVFLRDNIVLRADGVVVLRKAEGFSRPLISDCGFYYDRVKVADPSEWQVGWGVTLQAAPQPRGFFDDVRTIAAIEGDDLILDRPVDHSDFTVAGGATVQNVFPLIAGYGVTGAAVEGIICDGNAAHNPMINGCRGGAIYLCACQRCRIVRCVARNFNGDGISYQVSPYTEVIGCTAQDNTGLGLHPGSGSHHTLVRDCEVFRNGGVGLFLCWRVAHSRFEGNHIHDNGLFGVSIGHKDTDNLFVANTIEHNARHGVYFRDEPDYNAGHRCSLERNVIRNNGGAEDAAIRIDGHTVGTRIVGNTIADDREQPASCALHVGPNAREVTWSANEVTGFAREVVNESPAVSLP
ncbi:MAG: right-handed parallel beta-helix repeat-containing protein [Armatimonadota bacterium]